jgi:hypothetical protein
MRRRWTLGVMGLAALAVSSLASGLSKDKDKNNDNEALNRSFYVPVQLNVCEHLEGAVLFHGDEPLTKLPGSHVFQFTFFPALKRIEPELERVRVEGRDEGESFRMEIVVTPASIYVGDRKIDLDLEGQMRELRHHVDARHEPVTISLRCAHACGKSSPEGSR